MCHLSIFFKFQVFLEKFIFNDNCLHMAELLQFISKSASLHSTNIFPALATHKNLYSHTTIIKWRQPGLNAALFSRLIMQKHLAQHSDGKSVMRWRGEISLLAWGRKVLNLPYYKFMNTIEHVNLGYTSSTSICT